MKIAIAGAGAMGCRFGYMLLEAGHDVTLIDSWQEHVDAIRSKGLFVETETTQKYYPIPAMLADESGEFELVILFTKAMQLDSMLQRIKPLLPAAKVVMILSNGWKYRNAGEICRSAENLCGCDVMVQRTGGAGHIMATGTGTIELQPIASGFGSRG